MHVGAFDFIGCPKNNPLQSPNLLSEITTFKCTWLGSQGLRAKHITSFTNFYPFISLACLSIEFPWKKLTQDVAQHMPIHHPIHYPTFKSNSYLCRFWHDGLLACLKNRRQHQPHLLVLPTVFGQTYCAQSTHTKCPSRKKANQSRTL